MARLKLVQQTSAYGGCCYYRDFGVFTKTENPYAMDNWFFDIDTFGFRCTASKEILTINAHLPPPRRWRVIRSLTVPPIVERWSFAFDEPFDEAGRNASESLAYEVLCDPDQGIMQIIFGTRSQWADVFVSPHGKLLVGADPDRSMALSTVLLLDVDRFPQL